MRMEEMKGKCWESSLAKGKGSGLVEAMALGTETGSELQKVQAMATASGSGSAMQKELAWVLNSAPASESKSAPDSERTTAVEMARP